MTSPDLLSTPASLEDYWQALVTAALLGTNRREPPNPPVGLVADVVADAVAPNPAARMLTAVAAMSAARRAAFVPDSPAPTLQPPTTGDESVMVSVASVTNWREIVAEWPVLEDEWMLTVVEHGLTLSPDLLVELLIRHRGDVTRRARVALAGGPTVGWLVELIPDLEPTSSGTAAASAVASLPDLAVPPDLAELLHADAHTISTQLSAGFMDQAFGAPHRAVLINLLARCRPAVLAETASALSRVGSGMALALADLAGLRHRMLTELGAPT